VQDYCGNETACLIISTENHTAPPYFFRYKIRVPQTKKTYQPYDRELSAYTFHIWTRCCDNDCVTIMMRVKPVAVVSVAVAAVIGSMAHTPSDRWIKASLLHRLSVSSSEAKITQRQLTSSQCTLVLVSCCMDVRIMWLTKHESCTNSTGQAIALDIDVSIVSSYLQEVFSRSCLLVILNYWSPT